MLYEYCKSSVMVYVDPTGNGAILVLPVVAGGSAVMTAATKAALAAGMTVAGCYMVASCRLTMEQAIRDAIDALDAASIIALRAGCKAMHLAYSQLGNTCKRCIRGQADDCLGGFFQHWRCLHAATNLARFKGVLGMRVAYMASGCDLIIPPQKVDHLAKLNEVYNAIDRCVESITNNCFGSDISGVVVA